MTTQTDCDTFSTPSTDGAPNSCGGSYGGVPLAEPPRDYDDSYEPDYGPPDDIDALDPYAPATRSRHHVPPSDNGARRVPPGARPDPEHVSAATLAGLDDSQREAVLHLNGSLLVVAGPGSGKTRVLTRRLAALVDAGVYPSRLLAVTFTNKAAAEMRERLADLIGEAEAQRAQVSTFHSLCARILRYHHDELGLPRSFTILDSDDSARVVARAGITTGHTVGLERAEVTEFVKTTHSAISSAKNNGRTAEDLLASPHRTERATGEMMAAYQRHLVEMGAVDFDDLLGLVHWLLYNRPAAAARIRSRWTHVSVDEFQDTNAVQYGIVAALVEDHGNVCVVGDADQSIYAFRGAQPSVVRRFTDDYPHTRVVVLEHNYRSTAAICAVSRHVIAPNDATFRSPQHTTNAAGTPVTLTGYNSDFDEARAIVAKIRDRGGPLRNHGILVRTNSLTRALETELASRSLDYEVVGATRFYDRAEVKDTMAWLRLVANRRDQMAFARAISVPKRGVGGVTITKIVDAATDAQTDVLTAAASFGQGKTKVAEAVADFCQRIDLTTSIAERHGPQAAMEYIIENCGIRATVADRDAKDHTSRVENLDQLIAHAAQFAHHPDGPDAAMEAYLESVSLLESSDNDTGETDVVDDRVQILTVHAAKGKEFPHTYVVGLEENVMPHKRALDSGEAEELAEERRLMFVATSRAQKTLDMSWCATRMRFGKVEAALPSRFIDDLDKTELVITDPEPRDTWRSGGGSGGGSWGSGSRGSGSQRWAGNRSGSGRGPSSGAGRGARQTRPTWRPGTGTRPPAPARSTPPAAPPRARASVLGEVMVGTRVSHTMFGDGHVTALDHAADTVTVDFDSGATKLLSASLAPLTPLPND